MRQSKQQATRPMWQTLLIFLMILAAAWAVVILLVQRHIMFPRWVIPDTHQVAAPGYVETLWLDTDQGQVEAWFIPGEGASAESPAPLLIFAHGNGELIDHWPDLMSLYAQMGVNVLLPEYRGYGRSAGSPSQTRITDDFARWVDEVSQRPEVDGGRLIYHGRSIGGGVVASLAEKRPPQALILQSTFRNIPAIANRFAVPSFLVLDRFEVFGVVKDMAVPTLIIHGERDTIIPYNHATQLHDAVPTSELVTFDIDHNQLPPDREYWQAIENFLAENGMVDPK